MTSSGDTRDLDDMPVNDLGEPLASVCLVGPGWRFTSGISYYTCRLANALANNHDVSVVQIRHLLPRRLYPGRKRVGRFASSMTYATKVRVFSGIDWWWGSSILRAILFVRRHRPDVMVLQWWTAATLHTYLVLAVAGRAFGSRIAVEMHESQDPGESSYFFARWYGKLGLQLLLRLSHAALVHCQADRILLDQAFNLGNLPVLVAPHGPYDQYRDIAAADHDTERSDERDTAVALVQAAPRPSAINLLSFGLIRPYKGLEDLLCAFDGLPADEAARFWLTVVGETWENCGSISDLIKTNTHRQRITFVNEYVPDRAVAAAFRHADIVILPYRRSSSSGVLHIAMSYGLPVILTRVGGLPEAAKDYEGAIFVDPGNPDSLRSAIVRAAPLAGRRFTDAGGWSPVTEAILRIARSSATQLPDLRSRVSFAAQAVDETRSDRDQHPAEDLEPAFSDAKLTAAAHATDMEP
jgi:glycosyltransferase involved in cell wall biosynthesis